MKIITIKPINENSVTAFCHAATIVEYENTLVCVWFAGNYEGHRDCGIWMSRYRENKWQQPVNIVQGTLENTNVACWNPVLFYPSKGPLLLFYKVGIMPSRWRGMLVSSEDGGLSWSRPCLLPCGFYGPVKNKPLQLADGKILCGSSEEHGRWSVHIEYTSDLGNTWDKTLPLHDESIALIQPTILQFASGKIQILCRSGQGYIFGSDSCDQGKTWSTLYKTALPNPNSGIDAVTLADGRGLLVYNHSSQYRSPLNIAISSDEGNSWQQVLEVESKTGEYSYPAVIQANDRKVHIVYSRDCRQIKHAIVEVNSKEIIQL